MTFDPVGAVQQALAAHDVRANRIGEEILVPGSSLVLSAAVVRVNNYAKGTAIQLDIRAQSERFQNRHLIESFGGVGADEYEATRNAFSKSMRASMHVLLATLIDQDYGADEVEWESWSFEDKAWQACLGPVILLGHPPDSFLYAELIDRLRDGLLPSLSVGTHWLRSYFNKVDCHIIASEVLLDNDDSPMGRKILNSLNWPDGTYSARQFLVMLPANSLQG